MHIKQLLLLGFVFLLYVPVAAYAAANTSAPGSAKQQLAKAMQAYEQGDYEAAFSGWKALAQRGNAEAQYNLALLYRDGEGVAVDYDKAMTWYRKSAEQGYANAQSNIGAMYYKGIGVPQDYGKALEWYRKAAAQGLAVAQKNIGAMYYKGYGVPKDNTQAVKWLLLAKANGSRMARLYLNKIVPELTADQKDNAVKLAKKWWSLHHKKSP